MMKTKSLLLILLIFPAIQIWSQGLYTLNQAIQQAINSNRNIQLATNAAEIQANFATWGQAGLLPSLNGSAFVDYGNDQQKFLVTGANEATSRSGVVGKTYGASATLNYTIFSGFANLRTYERLTLNAELADANSKINIENIVLQVVSLYYNVIRTEANLKATEESLGLSRKRLELEEAKHELSGGTLLALLNVQVDLMKDSVTMVDAKLAKDKARWALNNALNFPLDSLLNIDEQTNFINAYEYDELRNQMLNQNYELMAMKKEVQVSMLDYKIAQSSFSPSLNLSSNYDYTYNEKDYSGFDYNRSNGFGATLSLSVPIYNGGRKRTALKNAKIGIENTNLQSEQLQQELEMELLSALQGYNIAIDKIKMQEKALEMAKRNFDLTNEKYNMGQIISTQFREAQLNLILAKNNLINAKFNAKLAELELLKLSGIILIQNK
ncbi:MAG: TolC family protein [Bacteroidales bacterium]|nr:TolC family protein [Bacteroidales bacterium]